MAARPANTYRAVRRNEFAMAKSSKKPAKSKGKPAPMSMKHEMGEMMMKGGKKGKGC